MKQRISRLAPLTLIAALVAGCGGNGDAGDGTNGGDGDAAGGEAVTVAATEYEFSPAEVSFPADTVTEVELSNEGVIEHDWTIDELDVQIAAAAGETATGTVEAPAGTYTVYCSVPGHRDQGMVGMVTVE